MAAQLNTPQDRVRFGEFEFDCGTRELKKNGQTVRLEPQPAKALSVLVRSAGVIVTRQELIREVWGTDTFVDFDQGLNYAIRRIRAALEDDADAPRFLETVPKTGYRLIAPIAKLTPGDKESVDPAPLLPARTRPKLNRVTIAGLVVIPVLTLSAIAIAWQYHRGQLSARSGAEFTSLAVLPLRNLSADPEQEYFSDGMTDELITDLAKSEKLRVTSHTSVERYKNTTTSAPEIAKQLGVQAIVEGTVMRSADKIRITAQLIDATSDRHLWAASYERDLRDVLALQDEVAQQIAAEIGINLDGMRQARADTNRAVEPFVLEAYLKGLFYWNQMACGGFHKAREYFQQAVDHDANFAPAYVGLAQTYFTLNDWNCSSDESFGEKAKMAAMKAVELEPDSGEAHAWLGKVAFFYDWDLPKAEVELRRSIELSPNYAVAHGMYATLLASTGRPDLGFAEMMRAREIDPVSKVTNAVGVFAFYMTRHYDDAIAQGRTFIELYPGSPIPYYWMSAAYEKKGLYDQAAAAYLKSKELDGVPATELVPLRTAYRKRGMPGLWQKELEAARRTNATCWTATVYAHLGETEQALEYLNRGVQQHCLIPHMILADPVFDDVRQDSRFEELISRVRVLHSHAVPSVKDSSNSQ